MLPMTNNLRILIYVLLLSQQGQCLLAQSLDSVLKKSINSVQQIYSGSYTLRHYWKPFNEEPIMNRFEINFRYSNNFNKVSCSIFDSAENSIHFYDSSVYKRKYKFRDSILVKIIADDPFNHLFEAIEPYFLEKYFYYYKRKVNVRDSNNFFIIEDYKDFDTTDEFINPITTFKFIKPDNIPFYHSIYVEELLADGSIQFELEVWEISNLQINNNEDYDFIKKAEENLKINKISFPTVSKKDLKDKVDSEIVLLDPLLNKEVTLSSQINNKGIIFLTYRGCQPCKQALPMLQKLQDSLNVEILAINMIDYNQREKVVEYLKINSINYPYFLSKDRRLDDCFDQVYPTFIIYNNYGKIIKTLKGYNKANYQSRLSEILFWLNKD